MNRIMWSLIFSLHLTSLNALAEPFSSWSTQNCSIDEIQSEDSSRNLSNDNSQIILGGVCCSWLDVRGCFKGC